MKPTYIIARDDRAAITCLLCGRTSYHPDDVENRYCGNCHIFHEDTEVKLYFSVELPDALTADFMQALRDFDTKHDPKHERRVHIEIVAESDWPKEKMANIMKAISPRPDFFAEGKIEESGAGELQKAKAKLATHQDCFEQLGVNTLAELVSKHERELAEVERESALVVQDGESGALYLYFQPQRKGEQGAAARTVAMAVQVDFDRDGNVFGIEIIEPLPLAVQE